MTSVAQLLNNPILNKMELVDKDANLNNIVTNVGIVDYEFDEQREEAVVYYEGDFLISSMYAAKNDEKLFLKIVKTLIGFGVSGLAIKNIYYQEIPKCVLEHAKRNRFPLFLFNNELNFEDIIYEVLFELKKIEKTNYYEQLIDNILKGFTTNQKGLELLNLKTNEYYIFLINTKTKINLSLLRNVGLTVNVYPYHNSIIVFAKKNYSLEYYLNYFKDELVEDYHIGCSEIEINLQVSLQRCISNLKAAVFKGVNIVTNHQDFLSVILEEYKNDNYQNFMNEYLSCLINDTCQLETMIEYHKNNGDIKLTAKKLNIHENTLRYRINKAKELLDAKNSDLEFYKNLSLALTVYRLNNIDFVI